MSIDFKKQLTDRKKGYLQQKVLCNWGLTLKQSSAVHIQALVSADGILPVISCKLQLLFIILASVPGRQLVNSPTDTKPRTLAAIVMRYTLIIISVLTLSCNEPLQKKNVVANRETLTLIDTTLKNEKLIVTSLSNIDTVVTYDYQTIPFDLVKNFPYIFDTVNFIKELKENCHLFDRPSKEEKINYFKKTKLYGSDKEFYIIEYDYRDGATCAFPWKYQIVFNTNGKLVKILSNIRVDIVKIFPRENPFLISVSSTGHGNGWHEINRIQSDTLEKVYDEFLSNRPQTYDRCEDNTVNEPNEFHYKIVDANNDAYNDITFYGKIVLIQGRTKQGNWYDNEIINGKTISYSVDNPFKKIPAAFTFLYNPKSGHFIEQEDYSKKYEYIFGDTK